MERAKQKKREELKFLMTNQLSFSNQGRSWKVLGLYAPADGEAELAALTERGVIDAVITKDSDVFPLGVQWVLLPDFKNSMVAKLMVHVYSAACIATQLNLTRDRLVFYSVLAGTDFGGVQGVGKSIALQLAQTGIADNLISDYQKPD
uniref:XPG-I domain-containing protein n=1 Tax=Moniliophthora roreri TaxID=221103 RepID=A0A0W0G1R6_MONRR